MKRNSIILLCALLSTSAFSQDLTALIDKCSPAIFKIITYDATGNEYAEGTGFFIDAQGDALTNYHVMQGAAKAKIKTADDKTYLVENVVSWTKESDLLKFKVKNELNETFPYIKLNGNTPKAGERIFIIGNPLGLEKSVADGIVSSVREDPDYGEVIQITAPISHGNSGSPLMNMAGEAYGVVTFFLDQGQNLNFAVSVKNMNIMESVNALKFPPEDGSDVVVTDNNGNNNNGNTPNLHGNIQNPNSNSTSDQYSDSRVFFCEEVDESGNPKNEAATFTIKPAGGILSVYVDNKAKALETPSLIVDIYKKTSSGEYDQFVETKNYTIKPTLTGTWFDYTFYNEGDYVFEVYNDQQAWINDGYVTINYEGGSDDNSSGDVINYTDPSNTFYFMDSKVQFCTDLDANSFPEDPSDVYSVNKTTGSYVYVWIGNNNKKFSTDQLKVEIYKKKGKDYDDYVDTKYFDIQPDWSDTHFQYTFYDAGDYVFKVYTKDDVWVNDGYVTIKYK